MRGARPEKNMSESFWHDLIELLLETELDIVVFGRGAEIFCSMTQDSRKFEQAGACSIYENFYF